MAGIRTLTDATVWRVSGPEQGHTGRFYDMLFVDDKSAILWMNFHKKNANLTISEVEVSVVKTWNPKKHANNQDA